jgi:hypothetical protein
MNLVSFNLKQYINFKYIDDLVCRVNVAWHSTSLYKDLDEVKEYKVFLDFDKGRQKPPKSGIQVDDLDQIIRDYPNIKYVAVSNVEQMIDLKEFIHLADRITLVPKIETARGIKLFLESVDPMYHYIPYVSLDHGDLFTDLVNNNLTSHLYKDWIDPFIKRAKEKGVKVLRERGLLFSEH